MNVSRLSGMLLAAGLGLFVWSCDAPVAPSSEADASAPLFGVDCAERPDHPQCDGSGGGGGGGGGGPSYTLELSGAVVVGPTAVELQRDTKRNLFVEGLLEVTFAFDLSGASCTLGLPDGYAGDETALRDYFIDIITGASGSPSTRNVDLGVNKPASTGAIRFLPLEELGDDRWVRLEHADAAGDFDGPGDRVITYTGGDVRVVARLSPISWEACSTTVPCKASDPLSDYVCTGWSESVVATLTENP